MLLGPNTINLKIRSSGNAAVFLVKNITTSFSENTTMSERLGNYEPTYVGS